MKDGNWIPLSKALVKDLPDDRPYSKVEAMYSITIDYDCGRQASIQGYAKLWNWSRKRVSLFLKKIGAEIIYDGHKKGQKKGHVGLHVGDMLQFKKGHVVIIDSKGFRQTGDMSKNKKEHVGDMLGSTTIEPNPKPKRKKKKENGFSLPDWIPKEEWLGYMEVRGRIKCANTSNAKTLLVNKLDRFRKNGHCLKTVLNNAIENSWKSVWEPKESPLMHKDDEAEFDKKMAAIRKKRRANEKKTNASM